LRPQAGRVAGGLRTHNLRRTPASSFAARSAAGADMRTGLGIVCYWVTVSVHSWIGLSDEVRLGVLTRWVSPELVDETLAAGGKLDRRPGALSARFMVNFILALALFHQDSYDDVAEIHLAHARGDAGEAAHGRPRGDVLCPLVSTPPQPAEPGRCRRAWHAARGLWPPGRTRRDVLHFAGGGQVTTADIDAGN
jgi:hypothetical protein